MAVVVVVGIVVLFSMPCGIDISKYMIELGFRNIGIVVEYFDANSDNDDWIARIDDTVSVLGTLNEGCKPPSQSRSSSIALPLFSFRLHSHC